MIVYLKRGISLFIILNFIYAPSAEAVRWQDLDGERQGIVTLMNRHRQAYASGADHYYDYLEGIQYMVQYASPPHKETYPKFTKPDILVDWRKNFREVKALINQGKNEQIFSEENKKRLKKQVKEIYRSVSNGLTNLEKEFEDQNAKEYKGLSTEQLLILTQEFKTTILPDSFGGTLLPLIAHNLWSDVETDSSVPSSSTPSSSTTPLLQLDTEKENEKGKEKEKEKEDQPIPAINPTIVTINPHPQLKEEQEKEDQEQHIPSIEVQENRVVEALKKIGLQGGWTDSYPSHLFSFKERPFLSFSVENNTNKAQTVTIHCIVGVEGMTASKMFNATKEIPSKQTAVYKYKASNTSGMMGMAFKNIFISEQSGKMKEIFSTGFNELPFYPQLILTLNTGNKKDTLRSLLSIGID